MYFSVTSDANAELANNIETATPVQTDITLNIVILTFLVLMNNGHENLDLLQFCTFTLNYASPQ
jgi:hypothetical protein